LIANELITNALKHAFPGPRRGEIVVRLRHDAESYQLEVEDDGVGLSEARRPSLGTRLVVALAAQLRGRAITEPLATGTRARVVFPARRD
jgi:two-component sensor histidine kinase